MKTFLVWTKYKSKTITIGAGVNNYDVFWEHEDMIMDWVVAWVHITTDNTISVKFDSISKESITITNTENIVSLPIFWITDIFITTTLNPAVVTIILQW